MSKHRYTVFETINGFAGIETTTYGSVAKELSAEPRKAREVGRAGHQPRAIDRACHRVLAAGGKIGGFSAPDGSPSKAKMLVLEQAHPPATTVAQSSFEF
jgi:methylated-DNA-[protein]-cysteine S-methyltransferase